MLESPLAAPVAPVHVHVKAEPRRSMSMPDIPRAPILPRFAIPENMAPSYAPGARMSLHQDRNERNLNAPIVSISLGLPATFLFGGQERRGRPQRVDLQHGDVLVWGGAARMNFHGVAPLAAGLHPQLGRQRINLTLRQAL